MNLVIKGSGKPAHECHTPGTDQNSSSISPDGGSAARSGPGASDAAGLDARSKHPCLVQVSDGLDETVRVLVDLCRLSRWRSCS